MKKIPHPTADPSAFLRPPPTRFLPPFLRHCYLLLLTLLLALPTAGAWAQQPVSNLVFTPPSSTLFVGETLRVTGTLSAPASLVLDCQSTSGIIRGAVPLTPFGAGNFELTYTITANDRVLANGDRLAFRLSVEANGVRSLVLPTSSYLIAAGSPPPTGQPDVTVALPAGQGLVVATAGTNVRLFAGVVISNRGTAPARGFNGAVVLSPSQTYSPSTLLRNPADGQIIRGNFAFADFAKSAGQSVAELPANGSFDVFAGSLPLPVSTYTALLAQSPVPLFAFAVVDFDNGLAESNENNNAVLLGQLTPPTGGGGSGLPATTLAVAAPTPPVSGGPAWVFTVTQPSTAAGLFVRVQSTLTPTTESSWTDLPGGGQATRSVTNPTQWTLSTNNIPLGARFFRAISAATGVADSISAPVGPFAVTTGTGGGTAPFTVDLKGIKEGAVIAPGSEVTPKAKIRVPEGVTANVAKVEFFVDDESAFVDTESPYKFTRTFLRPRTSTLRAVATDDQGRTATSAAVRFRVAAGAAGPLALDTAVEPAGGTVTPGTIIAYTFSVTNTGQTFAATNVVVTAPVPDDTNYDGAEVLDNAGSREVAADKRSVSFRFLDIPAGETRRAQLFVRLPFDARITGGAARPITTNGIVLTGNGFGGVAVEGRFEPVNLTPTGPLPARAPRLALLKTIADREDDAADDLDIVDDPEFGPIPAVGENGVLSLVFVASNYGEVPAQKVTIKDRIPDGFELVTGSARVNNTAAGALLKVNGRTIKFKLGDFQPGEIVALTYQVRKLPRGAAGEPVGRLVVESRGAEISSPSLRAAPDSIPEILPIRIVAKSIPMTLETFANPARPSVGGTQTYVVRYRNEGKASKNARITATLPAGTTFRSASNGGALQTDGRTVVFSLGDVPREGRGEVSVVADVTAAARADGNTRLRFSAVFSDNKFPARLAGADDPRARATTPGPVARVEGDDLQRPVVEDSFLADADIPRLGLIKYAPQSVPVGGLFSYLYVAVNHGKVVDRFVQVTINAPNGAVFDSFTSPTSNVALNRNATGYTILFGDLNPQQARAVKITFRATAPADTRINEGRTIAGSTSVPFRQQSLTTLVVDGDASAPDNQIAILRAQLEAIGLDATVALADPAVRARARLIGNDSGGFKVAGLDYLQLNNGALAAPIGAGQLVAAGGGNLVGNDGSTLVGNDGSTLVAAGGGNLIRFNGLVGNDGSTLVGNDGASLLGGRGLAALVAAGGGNLVAAGGGNLVGNDGASLVGLDGSTLQGISIASLVTDNGAGLVAAGGGNLVTDNGAGLVAAGGGNLAGRIAASLVAAGGGNLVAAGGGNLVGNDGASVLSRDLSRAAGLGANGTFIVGGGGPLVAAGGGN